MRSLPREGDAIPCRDAQLGAGVCPRVGITPTSHRSVPLLVGLQFASVSLPIESLSNENPRCQNLPARCRARRTVRLFAGMVRPARRVLVEIVGEDGSSGWGEAFGPARLTAPIVDFYKPLLVGADALATELHWQNLYNRLRDHGQKGLAIEALSAVDIALWDLKGRHLGLPVHRLMGGPLRSRVQAYATGFYRKGGGDPVTIFSRRRDSAPTRALRRSNSSSVSASTRIFGSAVRCAGRSART